MLYFIGNNILTLQQCIFTWIPGEQTITNSNTCYNFDITNSRVPIPTALNSTNLLVARYDSVYKKTYFNYYKINNRTSFELYHTGSFNKVIYEMHSTEVEDEVIISYTDFLDGIGTQNPTGYVNKFSISTLQPILSKPIYSKFKQGFFFVSTLKDKIMVINSGVIPTNYSIASQGIYAYNFFF